MDVPARFLLTAVAFGANLVQLSVVPAVALESANVVETPLIGDAHGQGFDAQVKGYGTVVAHGALLALFALLAGMVFGILVLLLLRIIVHERAIVASSRISGHRHFPKVFRRRLGKMATILG